MTLGTEAYMEAAEALAESAKGRLSVLLPCRPKLAADEERRVRNLVWLMSTAVLAASGCKASISGGADQSNDVDAAVAMDRPIADAGSDSAAADSAEADDARDESDAGPSPFDLTRLHVIAITVAAQYLAPLDNDLEMRQPASLEFDGLKLAMVGIRKQGSCSIMPLESKPSFSMSFDEFVPKQKLLGLRKLILKSTGSQDVSFVAEHTAYEIYRRAGLPASLTAHAVVTFNGVVKGIYVMREAVDTDFLERNFGKGFEKGNLYDLQLTAAFCGDFCTGKGFLNPSCKGPMRDFATNPDSPVVRLKDEKKEMRSRDDLRALSEVMTTAANDAWGDAVTKRFDLDRFITSYAIDALLGSWDSYHFNFNNYYLYHNPVDDRIVLIATGMDHLFEFSVDGVPSDPRAQLTYGGWVSHKVRQLPMLDRAFSDAIQRALTTVWDVPALQARVDQVGKVLHSATTTAAAVARDVSSFDANSARVKEFLTDRKAALLTR